MPEARCRNNSLLNNLKASQYSRADWPIGSNMILERLEQELKQNQKLRSYIREVANCKGKCFPIEIVDGDAVPCHVGRRGVNVKGKRLWPWHYRKQTYSPSTQRVRVGGDWLLEVVLTKAYVKKEQVDDSGEAGTRTSEQQTTS